MAFMWSFWPPDANFFCLPFGACQVVWRFSESAAGDEVTRLVRLNQKSELKDDEMQRRDELRSRVTMLSSSQRLYIKMAATCSHCTKMKPKFPGYGRCHLVFLSQSVDQ